MPFELDPVDYYKRMTSARAKEDNDFSDAFTKFESGMARGYAQESKQGGGLSSVMNSISSGVNDNAGTNAVMGDIAANQQMAMGLGMAALDAKTDMEVAEMQADAAERQGKKNRAAGTRNAIIGAVGGIGAAAIGAAI